MCAAAPDSLCVAPPWCFLEHTASGVFELDATLFMNYCPSDSLCSVPSSLFHST